MIKRLADRFFKWFCREDLHLFVQGDLEEQYDKLRNAHSTRKANWLYLREVLLLLRPAMIRSFSIPMFHSLPLTMFRNYLKIALRNLRRQATYTIVNVIGLSTGMISLFFIWIFIESELSYDKHHRDNERLYRVTTEATVNGEQITMATSPPGLSRRLLKDLPEIETSARIVGFLGIKNNILRVEDRTFLQEGGYFADPNIFELLSYPILTGNPATLLDEPQTVVLSHELTIKVFGNTDVVGKTVTIINDYGQSDYEVTGVYDERNVLSHINPTFICSMNSGSIGKFVMGNDVIAGNNFLFTYVKTQLPLVPGELESKIPEFLKSYLDEVKHTHGFMPVKDIYLQSGIQNESSIGGDQRYIYILMTIGALILIVACVNFANLATAQASRRAKEIGIRKTFGAQKGMIVSQFLGEALVLCTISLLFSMIIIYVLAPHYSHLTGKEITLSMILNHVPHLLVIGLLTSLLAGSYPAFYLSHVKLQWIFQQKNGSAGSQFVRRALVVFQFMVGILFIVGSSTTIRQLNFIQSKPLGFKTTDQVVIPLQAEEAINQLEKVKAAFLAVPGVLSVAGTSYTPAEFVLSDNHYSTSRSAEGERVVIRQNDIDFGLVETLQVPLIAGRTFDRTFAQNDSSVILNESAVRALGTTPEAIIDQLIYTSEGEGIIGYKVIGVVEDFHTASLHRPIEPYLFAMRPGRGVSTLILTVQQDRQQEILSTLEHQWSQLFPLLPFEFDFLDQQLASRYAMDQKFVQVIVLFTIVALILCLMGIFALTSFTIQQSIRAISIRKVLGASVKSIFGTMVMKFIGLVLLASVIAVPLGIILMNKWLELFAYRIEPGVISALVPVLIIVMSTLLVISQKLLGLARVNPSKILRSE